MLKHLHAGAMVFAVIGSLLTSAVHADWQPTDIEGHQPIAADEHPRLVFRGEQQLARMKQAGETDFGKTVLNRLEQTVRLMDKAPITGRSQEVVREAGYRAAGHAALYALEADPGHARAAADVLLTEVVGYPLRSRLDVMDRAAQTIGAALAYDLAHDAWSPATRGKVQQFLLTESGKLLETVGGTDARRFANEKWVSAVAAAGLAELALLEDVDSPGVEKRLRQIEQAVIAYLDNAISDDGFGVYGEPVKHAAFASGVLPYVHGLRNVTGRDLASHPAIRSTLTPMIYQTVPGAGMPVYGSTTLQLDRTGIFALSGEFLPDDIKPVAKWLLFQLGGDRYAGVVRPHHALYMLDSGLVETEPQQPGENWATHVRSDAANLALVRSGYDGPDDLMFMIQDGVPRMLGLGHRWITAAGPHAHIWSDSPGAGAIDNRLLFQTQPAKRTTVYRQNADYKLDDLSLGDDGQTASIRYTFDGKLNRTREKYETTERVGGEKVKTVHEVAPGGDFAGQRVIGVDFSGRSGAEAVIVFADHLTGPSTLREWVLHMGEKFEMVGNTFTTTSGDETLTGIVVSPAGAAVRGTPNFPTANFMHVPVETDEVQVILIVQRGGNTPKVEAGDKGLAGGVKVGKTTVRLVDDRIVFE